MPLWIKIITLGFAPLVFKAIDKIAEKRAARREQEARLKREAKKKDD